MISFVNIIVYVYVSILILRSVMTMQELHFNPIGKVVATTTDPIFNNIFKGKPKEQTDKFISVFIAIIALMLGVYYWALRGGGLITSILMGFNNIIGFIMIFYMISLLLGSLVNTAGASFVTTFFYRIGLFWVKLVRTFVPISGNLVVFIAILLVFIVFTFLNAIISGFYLYISSGKLLYLYPFVISAQGSLISIINLLRIFVWLIIARALMSWVNPDPRNIFVQIIHSLTEPVMAPFRKIIPPLGLIDLSPIILIFLIEFMRIFLLRLIGTIF